MLIIYAAAATPGVQNQRLAIVLGILTLLAALAAFFSCRICMMWLRRLGFKNLPQNRVYMGFYKFHIYYWWAFGVLMVAHFMVAVVHTGLPQAGDPDAPIHWWILGLGLFSAISAIAVFFSCRIIPKIMSMAGAKNPHSSGGGKLFFQGHSYYWMILGLLALSHFLTALSHSGIWPG